MSSGLENNSLKLDGDALSKFADHLNKSHVSAVFRDAMVNFVKSLKVEDGIAPMEMNELVAIVEKFFDDPLFKEFMKKSAKKVVNKVASRLRSSPVFYYDGRGIEMLLSDEARFETAFEKALKSVPKGNSDEDLVVSKDCLCTMIYGVLPAQSLPQIGASPQMDEIMRNLVKIVHGEFETKKWNANSFKNKIKRLLKSIASDLKSEPISVRQTLTTPTNHLIKKA